jgi:hypothetical protein
MRIFYIDESFDKNVYVLCGVVVTAKSYGKITRDFNKLLKKICNLDEDKEFKGEWLFNGRKYFEELSLNERSEIAINISKFFVESTLSKFIVGFIKDYEDNEKAYLNILECLISEAAKIASKSGRTAKQLLVIFDELGRNIEKKIYLKLSDNKKEIIKKYKKSCTFFDYGYSGLSCNSRMLQIADFIAYFLRNYISTPFGDSLFESRADIRKVEMLKTFKEIIDKKLIMRPC